MTRLKSWRLVALAAIPALLLVGCWQQQEVAVAVSLTQTAAALEALPPPAAPTEPPTAAPTETPSATATQDTQADAALAGLEPLSQDECARLSGAVSEALDSRGYMTQAALEDRASQETGTGCQTIITSTGEHFDNVGVIADEVTDTLESRGWREDVNLSGGGPGGVLAGYRKASDLCMLVVSSAPAQGADRCPQDEPFSVCWENLAPDERAYTVDLNCGRRTTAATAAEANDLPRVVPPEFQLHLQALVLTGVPVMLPPEFPVDVGQPAVYPFIITAEAGLYELSLDYGEDCLGAGACHYGSLAGMRVDSETPVGTPTFPYDAGRAQRATLANGIEGYFIESSCGASCDDARVFWVYEGYEYMVGVKGGPPEAVIDLANAAIMNSLP